MTRRGGPGRQRLEQRILSANTIVLFGGRLDLLLDALRLLSPARRAGGGAAARGADRGDVGGGDGAV
jgi:hypothetical protein